MRGVTARLAAGVLVVAVPWIVAALVPGQQRYVLHILVFMMIAVLLWRPHGLFGRRIGI